MKLLSTASISYKEIILIGLWNPQFVNEWYFEELHDRCSNCSRCGQFIVVSKAIPESKAVHKDQGLWEPFPS
jgi:hypothetical protein